MCECVYRAVVVFVVSVSHLIRIHDTSVPYRSGSLTFHTHDHFNLVAPFRLLFVAIALLTASAPATAKPDFVFI